MNSTNIADKLMKFAGQLGMTTGANQVLWEKRDT